MKPDDDINADVHSFRGSTIGKGTFVSFRDAILRAYSVVGMLPTLFHMSLSGTTVLHKKHEPHFAVRVFLTIMMLFKAVVLE